jgi:hypothetical protein
MAKSKEQKQREAVERSRLHLDRVREVWFKYQPGGELYSLELSRAGKMSADTLALEHTRRLKLAAAAAQCDTHGNPLSIGKLELSPGAQLISENF